MLCYAMLRYATMLHHLENQCHRVIIAPSGEKSELHLVLVEAHWGWNHAAPRLPRKCFQRRRSRSSIITDRVVFMLHTGLKLL